MGPPSGATLFGFLVGAATAANVIPVVLYGATQLQTAILAAICGVVVAPFATLVGVGLKNRVNAWRSGIS